MIYKAFAALTLIAAPLLVITVQSFSPHPQDGTAVQPVQAAAPPPVQAASAPAPALSAAPSPVPAPASFGQPMADAGKPFIAPGNGLPAGNPHPPGSVQGPPGGALQAHAE